MRDDTAVPAPSGAGHPENVPRGINPETLTYSELIELRIRQRGWADPRRAKNYRSRAKSFCRLLGRSAADPAKKYFNEHFGELLAKATEARAKISKVAGSRAAKNMRYVVCELRGVYESLRTDTSLPIDFAGALKAALEQKSWGAGRLVKELDARYGGSHNASIYNYLARTAHPRSVRGVELVMRLEAVLELENGTLHTRAFAERPLLKAGSTAPNGYRRRHSELTRATPYELKALPKQFGKLWPQIVDWRSRSSIMTPSGTANTIKHPWRKPATIKMNRKYLLRFMGFLHLPVADKPLYELKLEERWEHGKGVALEDLSFAQWFDVQLLHAYVEWRKERQWAGEQTVECIQVVDTVSLLCKYEHSFVNMHPQLAPLFGLTPMPAKEWNQYVAANLYEPLRKMIKEMRKARPASLSRVPEDALRHVLHDADPMLLMNQMITQMERDAPSIIHKQRYAIHQRNVAIFHLLLQIPLRARNVFELTIGRTIRKDEKTGSWWVDIPKENLKNARSPEARAVLRELDPEASRAIDAYVTEGRRILDPEGNATALFLVEKKGAKPNAKKKSDPSQALTQPALEHILRKYLVRYFGVAAGPHFFRHLLATAILRDDPSAVFSAAAVLNISEAVCRKRYAHLLQQDGLDQANAFLRDKRMKNQVLNGTSRVGRPRG